MTERSWSVEPRTRAIFCKDVLKDGRSFTWFKEFDARADRGAYWFQIGRKANISIFDFLTVTDRSGMVIESVSFVSGEGNIKILYSADGLAHSIVMTENYASPWECSAVYNILTRKHEVQKDKTLKYFNYQEVNGGFEIRDRDNIIRLRLSFPARDSLWVGSDSWEQPTWQVDLSPLPWQQLLVFSPSKWGNSGKAEQITRATEAIIETKIKPLRI